MVSGPFLFPFRKHKSFATFLITRARLLQKGPMALIHDAALSALRWIKPKGHSSDSTCLSVGIDLRLRQSITESCGHSGVCGFTLVVSTSLGTWPVLRTTTWRGPTGYGHSLSGRTPACPRSLCSVTASNVPSISSVIKPFANPA